MLSYLKQLYLPANPAAVKVFPGLNGAKGILVLLVVLTHCLPPSMMLYFLYFFHMPLFMAISGFLLKESAFQNGYSVYMSRLWHRLIVPWLVASVIFLPFRLSSGQGSQLHFADIIYPYYHLWYIPSYLIGASICYAIVRYQVRVWPVLFFTAAFTMIWYNIYRDNHLPVSELPLYWLGEKRFFAYLFFFISGFCMRNMEIKLKFTLNQLLAIKTVSFTALLFLVFKNYSSLVIVWPYMIFNTALVIFILIYIAPQQWLQNKLFLKVNEQSLGIYLYHPFILTSIYILLNDRGKTNISNLQALGVFVITMSLTMGLCWMLQRFKFTDKYMLGNIKR